jgi:ring-1,2-phenylacetyl-CoA epoxidase subunit PaaE
MELLQWKVIQVTKETSDTCTYVLEEINGRPASWEAGQSLTFLFYHHQHEIRRSYSICSTPGVDKHIAITVKRKANGEISRYILSNWQYGTVVGSLPPAGRFIVDTHPAQQRRFYFIAAGSGIVPVFALIKKVLYYEPNSSITLYYQNHDEYAIIYNRNLQLLAEQYPQRLVRIDLLSNPTRADAKPVRLNNWLLEQLLTTNHKPPTTNSLFYTCGPEPFMRMVLFTLRVMGYSNDQLRKEHFVIETPRQPAFTINPAPHTVVMQHGGQIRRFATAWPDTILKAAQKQGIEMPYSCNTGRCGTCVVKCKKGSVKMSNNEVLIDNDLQQGLILTCTGYAETDLEIEW